MKIDLFEAHLIQVHIFLIFEVDYKHTFNTIRHTSFLYNYAVHNLNWIMT